MLDNFGHTLYIWDMEFCNGLMMATGRVHVYNRSLQDYMIGGALQAVHGN